MSEGGRRATPGIQLSREFYHHAVRPILTERWGDLPHSAALIGPGSEVLGYDDVTSTDHHWGPRVLLFVESTLPITTRQSIHEALAARLPRLFGGYPTSFTPPDPDDHGTQLLDSNATGPINHRVEIRDLNEWLAHYLGVDPCAGLTPVEWLSIPQQKLLTLVAGEVFHDGLPEPSAAHGVTGNAASPPAASGSEIDTLSNLVDPGALTRLRASLAWYPDDVWRYQLAATWTRVAQEEHLVGRAGSTGDESGARIICSRLVRDLMRLLFLYRRTYAPYAKWFGRAFDGLEGAEELAPVLREVLSAEEWKRRDRALGQAYRIIGLTHDASGLTEPVGAEPHQFHGRPFTVLADRGYADALLATIDEEWLDAALRRSPVGGIDLISDNTDVLENPGMCRQIVPLLHRRTEGATQ